MFTDKVIASFCLGESRISLVPARMANAGNDYTAEFDGVQVTLTLRRLSENAAEWILRFRNMTDGDSPLLSDIRAMDITLPARTECVWHTLRGDTCDGNSFLPVDTALSVGDTAFIAPDAGGRPSQGACFPFFDVEYDGGAAAIALGWSGIWDAGMERSESGVRLWARQSRMCFRLKGGETARSLRCLVLMGESTQCVRHDLRRLLRQCYSPAACLGADFQPPLSVQCFDRYFNSTPGYRTMDAQMKVLAGASRCEKVDTFWLDATWFKDFFPNGVGNYTFDTGFPDGLLPLSEAAKAKGMKFMVWFEPERIHIGSDTFRDHPEWTLDNGTNAESRLLDLGNPAALKWLTHTLVRFIADNGITIYREDFNIDPASYWAFNDEPDRQGMKEMRFVEGLYALWDALKEAYPRMMIDNCSSGGRRIDLETVMRAVPCWRSDIGCFPDGDKTPVSLWKQNETLTLSRYLPYHLTSAWEADGYRFRSGATMGIACAFDFMDPAYDVTEARKATEELVRDRDLWQGDFYALTEPSLRDDVFCAWQLAKGTEGTVRVFRRPSCEEDTFLLRLRAVNANKQYKVTLWDERYASSVFTVSGGKLASGYAVRLPEKRSSLALGYSELA